METLVGTCIHNNKKFLLVDIPGTYSLMSNSEEEEIARNYICFGNPNATVIVLDATCIEKNLNLVFQTMEITKNIVVCVNLLDEAEKKGISIDFKKLSLELGVPVVGTTARNPKTLKKLLNTIFEVCVNSNTHPKSIKYLPIIEDSILMLLPILQQLLPSTDPFLLRWIALKLIDNNIDILKSIEESFNVSLTENELINNKLLEIRTLLNKNDINEENFRDNVVTSIINKCEEVVLHTVKFSRTNYNEKDRKLDKILTSKKFGIPIMILFLGIIFWLTTTGANYPSSLLSSFFAYVQEKLLLFLNYINAPDWFIGVFVHGMYQTLTWVIAVMLPPMAIFFPLFTLLEDLGYLPRIAFNLDNFFKKACTTGKQALTMCMGFGCNAAGVVGCRIIDSPRERLIAILTNVFVPCNGRFPLLITISSIFIGSVATGFGASLLSTITVLLVIIFGIYLTLVVSKLLSLTILKGLPSSFILELPPYRKPQIGKVIVRSIFDRTLHILGRAICVAAPCGIIIWLFANVTICNVSILDYVANFFDPFAKLMGLDGYIITAFILGLPANEIVLPIILMSYMSNGSLVNLEDSYTIGTILKENGWTLLTAFNVMFFTLLHFPCSTTLLTIKKETNSWKWTFISFAIPTLCGIIVCMCTTLVWNIANFIIG